MILQSVPAKCQRLVAAFECWFMYTGQNSSKLLKFIAPKPKPKPKPRSRKPRIPDKDLIFSTNQQITLIQATRSVLAFHMLIDQKLWFFLFRG